MTFPSSSARDNLPEELPTPPASTLLPPRFSVTLHGIHALQVRGAHLRGEWYMVQLYLPDAGDVVLYVRGWAELTRLHDELAGALLALEQEANRRERGPAAPLGGGTP